ncbi:methyltransferase-like protein 6 [Fistulifera solaris]|jgi:tRNA/tmRNA/rRNA uracil-C5-methylase (TrmA/RlmC/RlmD family)|uniref:Methyltransferase-like protein 6 n=1 Tax=Fistulifera solaris TaxID=1519565 RepID=A0A1Z5JE40_FISSO|nr:methyltransferase-like protein 6 [Fistulifera solaris]|eukprot:GAX12257.1 methyltransferase-like protein 6 [Fistulifera solaris]
MANRNPAVNQRRHEEAIGCKHFQDCSGCVVDQNVAAVGVVQSAKFYFSSTSVRRKRVDVLNRGLPFATEEKDDGFYKVVVPSKVQAWRTQAKLAVAPKSSTWSKDGCQFGLFRQGTHTVLEIPDCAVHHPSINRAVHALVDATEKLGIAAYQETTREYGLRYVQFQVERVTGKICLTLIWNAETLKQTQPALSRLIKELEAKEPDLWHSFWCHCNDSTGNNIFSRNPRRWHRIAGPEFIREPIPATDQGWLYFSPLTFRQGNLDGFDILAEDVARAIPGGSKVCELYAGVGVLGLTALSYHANEENGSSPLPWIRCSDENPSNSRCFYRAVDSLPLNVSGRGVGQMQGDSDEKFLTLAELASMVESGKTPPTSQGSKREEPSYLVASAGQALKAGQALGAQVLIVDPPRKGLEAEVLDELCKPFNSNQPYVERSTFLTMFDDKVNWVNDVETLIYVSCGFDALARDCECLLSSPAGWVLQSATGYVLFPGSDHVETLAIFKRK